MKIIIGTKMILIISNVIDFSKKFPFSGKTVSLVGVVLMRDKLNGESLDVLFIRSKKVFVYIK